jgi:hypothetical protein
VARDLAEARAPFDARLYESHYLTAVDPAGGRALWLRHTALHGKPSVWVTWFDPEPHAQRVELDEPLSTSSWPRCSLGALTGTSARGQVGDTAWDLSWEPRAEPLPYLPSTRLYDRAFPRSQGVAVVPDAVLSGTYDGTSLDGWRGVVGHNWGRDHAEQWCWLHAPLPEGWLDLVLVRIRVGRLLTPWTAGGGLSVDGTLRRTRPGRVRLAVDGPRTVARVPLRDGALTLEVEGTHEVTWDYAAPSGPGRAVRNCSVADAHLALDDGRTWDLTGTVAVEHGRPA